MHRTCCTQMERLATPADLDKYEELRGWVAGCRGEEDPPPVWIRPAPEPYCKVNDCVRNVTAYVGMNGGTVVKGLKVWVQVMPGLPLVMNACAHFVVRADDGAHVCVTPPNAGDENKDMLFVPSSKLFEGFDATTLPDLVGRDIQLRCGALFLPPTYCRVETSRNPVHAQLCSDDVASVRLLLVVRPSCFEKEDTARRCLRRDVVDGDTALVDHRRFLAIERIVASP